MTKAPIDAVPEAPALPEGWRWYLCARTGAPYLVHMHDVELTLEDIRALLASQGLAIVELPTTPLEVMRAIAARSGLSIIGAKDRAVLEACAAFPTAALKHDAQMNRKELSDLSLRWTEAELARREGK